MKTIILNDLEIKKLLDLISQNNELYEIENWSISNLDAFREIGTEFITILHKHLND
jgi:hypothetical protein